MLSWALSKTEGCVGYTKRETVRIRPQRWSVELGSGVSPAETRSVETDTLDGIKRCLEIIHCTLIARHGVLGTQNCVTKEEWTPS